MTHNIKLVPHVSQTRRPRRRHVVAAVAYEGLSTFEFGIVVELFGLRRPEIDNWYEFIVCGETMRPSAASGGVQFVARSGYAGLARADTIVIPGWRDVHERPPERLIQILLREHARGARLVSICSGTFVLAATGLLDGRRATTHWRHTELLRHDYPRIQVDPAVLYVDEGDILTSAGSAAGIDLCLHIIRRDFGARVVNDVARRLVMAPHREGGQAQFIPHPVGDATEPWLSDLMQWTERHLHEPLTTGRLAAVARMTRRTFFRRFSAMTGGSPADWLTGLRIARARDLLETSAKPIERIAWECGFGSAATMRHHFHQRLKVSPASYRAARKSELPVRERWSTRAVRARAAG
jgi:AraC family transcriptional regulator, transcriptional activator FtrA